MEIHLADGGGHHQRDSDEFGGIELPDVRAAGGWKNDEEEDPLGCAMRGRGVLRESKVSATHKKVDPQLINPTNQGSGGRGNDGVTSGTRTHDIQNHNLTL